MDLTTEQIQNILAEHYPRHVTDVFVALLDHPHAPNDDIVLLFDTNLWVEGMTLTPAAHSMSLAQARRLRGLLDEAVKAVEAGVV